MKCLLGINIRKTIKMQPKLFNLPISSQGNISAKTLKVAIRISAPCEKQFEYHCLGIKKSHFKKYIS